MAADAAGIPALYVLCAQGCADGRWPEALEVEPGLLASVCALRSGSRVVAVFEQRWSARADGPLAVALWGVRDPGNVGTVLRAAHAFGASCVALGPQCADPFGPRAARASMGAIFATNIARFSRVDELPGRIVALEAGAGRALRGPLAGELTLLVGGERDGIPRDVRDACDEACSIPQVAGDSLNAAMAATIALYELGHRMRAQ